MLPHHPLRCDVLDIAFQRSHQIYLESSCGEKYIDITRKNKIMTKNVILIKTLEMTTAKENINQENTSFIPWLLK